MIHNSLEFLSRVWNREKIEDLSMIYKATDLYENCSIIKAYKQLASLYDDLRNTNYEAFKEEKLGIPMLANEDWITFCLPFVYAREVSLWNKTSLRQIYLYYLNSPDVADCLECFQGIVKLNRNKMRRRMEGYSLEVQHTVILLVSIMYLFEKPRLNIKEQVRRRNKIDYLIERIYHETDYKVSDAKSSGKIQANF